MTTPNAAHPLACLLVVACLLSGWLAGTPGAAQSSSRATAPKHAQSVAQAIKQAKQSGQPIFAVAGANYCPACKVLLNTLNTDESLRPLLSQFVALKINAESREYSQWKKFFPPEKAAIPAMFIVSAQGEQLFGKVGTLPSENLSKIMLASLEKAGRYPTQAEWQALAEELTSAEQLLEANEQALALELLEPLVDDLASLGGLLEISETGKQASELLQRLAKEQQAALTEAIKSFAPQDDMQSALSIAGAQRYLELFPELGSQAALEIKKGVSSSAQRKLLKQASELLEAESLAKREKTRRKGVRLLQRLAKRSPNPAVAARAEQTLETLEKSKPRRGTTSKR